MAPAQVSDSPNEANLKWELHQLKNCGDGRGSVGNRGHMKRSSFDKTRIVSGLAELYSPAHYATPMNRSAPSFIRTVTVGPGISPGRLPCDCGRWRALPPVGTFTPP